MSMTILDSNLKMNELEIFRTRWYRWLGQKCRKDKPYWTTLLNSNWSGWAEGILDKNHRVFLVMLGPRENVKECFRIAIELADMRDLNILDNLYASEKINNL